MGKSIEMKDILKELRIDMELVNYCINDDEFMWKGENEVACSVRNICNLIGWKYYQFFVLTYCIWNYIKSYNGNDSLAWCSAL